MAETAVRSMTGFGRGTTEVGAFSVTVEMKSVNLRGLEVKVRLPRAFAELESRLVRQVKEGLERGRVDVAVDIAASGTNSGLQVNRQRLQEVLREVRALEAALGSAPSPVSPVDLLRFPGVLAEDLQIDDPVTVAAGVVSAAAVALQGLQAARAEEGQGLAADLRLRRDNIARMVDEIDERMAASAGERREKLEKRLGELLGEHLEPARLTAELAALTERLDVSEEMARLRLHLQQLDSLLKTPASGRRIDFLCQELLREANTTASKCQDAAVAHVVVELKAEIERLREQAQNVE